MSGEVETPASVRRHELSAFLRARRAEVRPEDVGIVRRGRRRVGGLRRHELADLAGVSVTWYTWLEQGRDIRFSAQALDAVSRVLRLNDDEWRHVRRLAGRPVDDPQVAPVEAAPELIAMVDELLPSPACLTTGPFDLLAWNAAYAAIFSDPATLPARHRNVMWIFFVCSETRERVTFWEHGTEAAVAYFRAEAGRYAGDSRFIEFIDELMEASGEFRDIWHRCQVRRFVPHDVTFDLPIGEVRTRLMQLRPLDQAGLTLMFYRPLDEESRERLTKFVSGPPR